MDILTEIRVIQNVGCFEKAASLSGARFKRCTLIFGENGWGKSTFADILRSLADHNPDIILGRRTLAGGPEQKVVLGFGTTMVRYSDNGWEGGRPRIKVFDSAFINDNVYSGDEVSTGHVQNQYELVVGEESVKEMQEVRRVDGEIQNITSRVRDIDAQLKATIRGLGAEDVTPEKFIEIGPIPDIAKKIEKKEQQVTRAQKSNEILSAQAPKLLLCPPDIEKTSEIFGASLESVSEYALAAVKNHIESHRAAHGGGTGSHETWLEQGMAYMKENQCPFCGQETTAATLVGAYAQYFNNEYKQLLRRVQEARKELLDLSRYRSECGMQHEYNKERLQYWQTVAQIDLPDLCDINLQLQNAERTAEALDGLLARKQENVTEEIGNADYAGVLSEWNNIRKEIKDYNSEIEIYSEKVQKIKASIDTDELPKLKKEIEGLRLVGLRYAEENVALVNERHMLLSNKDRLTKEKKAIRERIGEYEKRIMKSLGSEINSYLSRLNARFRVEYGDPHYRGKEPAVNCKILIREVPIQLHSTKQSATAPSFKNTLSAGDKSVLALALFLAQVRSSDQLRETIVVLDDPFSSLDNFRRQFTAAEIQKVVGEAAQTVVLSHDKYFLRLLWDTIDHNIIANLAFQTGAQNIITVAPYDIEEETTPREVTDRIKIVSFVNGEAHDEQNIRLLLRTVCENFYRRGDRVLFPKNATLDKIIRLLKDADDSHPYKSAVDDLESINRYTRPGHHAPTLGDPNVESSKEELRGFCVKVLDLTWGMG